MFLMRKFHTFSDSNFHSSRCSVNPQNNNSVWTDGVYFCIETWKRENTEVGRKEGRREEWEEGMKGKRTQRSKKMEGRTHRRKEYDRE